MKLTNAELFLEIEIEECRPAILVIENPGIMAEIVEDLYNLCNAEKGNFVLSEGRKELNLANKTEIIINPFSIDFNSKKIQTKLFHEMQESGCAYVEEESQIQSFAIGFLDRIVQDVPYEMIEYDIELDLLRFFKLFNVRLEPKCDTLLERLTEYSKVMTRLLKEDFLILTNICGYLTEKEIASFVQMCIYQKLKVLFIENCERCFTFPVTTYIIDSDKCLIIK